MTKAENDYQYTLEKRILDLEADNRRLNFYKQDYEQQFSLQGVSQQRELLQKIESVKNFEWGINPVDNENRMCELIKLL